VRQAEAREQGRREEPQLKVVILKYKNIKVIRTIFFFN
jgi:hypothetical protein